MSGERRRILDMLAEDRITVDQAEALLRALHGNGAGGTDASAGTVPDPAAPPAAARSLQIQIKGKGPRGPADANITVPLGLARFASRFLPGSLRDELDDQDVDIDDVLKALLEDGTLASGSVLVDISSDEGKTIVVKAV